MTTVGPSTGLPSPPPTCDPRTPKPAETAVEQRDATSLSLPGLDEIDTTLVDQVVAEVNRVHAVRGLELARELGEILLDRFFGGDLDSYRRTEKRHASFRALAERDDLSVSHAQLWYSLAVLDQLRALPDDIGSALSMHHHKTLLSVRDAQTKRDLATRALDEGWSYRDLAREVRKVKGPSNAGRPPLPTWVKGLKRLVRSAEEALSVEVCEDDFDHFQPGDARRLIDQLDDQVARLMDLKERVLSRAAEVEGVEAG